MLGMQLRLGLEISGLVGHVYPSVCACVCVYEWGGRVRERVRDRRVGERES